jgi:septal ring factor EnvC (AmiA/AmiB activator)
MSKQLSGRELIELIKKKIDFDGTVRTDNTTLAWLKVATCLAADLSLVLGRMASAQRQCDKMETRIARKDTQIQELRKTIKQLRGK